MTAQPPRRKEPKAGGFFIAMGTLGGVLIGARFGEPVIGLLAGLALGIVIAIALWRAG